jgi:mannose-6-phosphate isomerase-like protein (cupin superfamily)
MRRNWCRQAFIFTGTDDPNVASFDVVLGKGGSGGGNALVHVHPLAEERFLVTSGRIKVVFDGRPQRASAHSRLWHAEVVAACPLSGDERT